MLPRAQKIKLESLQGNFTSKMTNLDEVKQTTGAIPTTDESVASKISNVKNKTVENKDALEHQTHGAIIPSGPISSVGQLISGRATKASIGSFETLDNYKTYINNLALGELRQHAIEEARIVPVEDRNRLIRRLESEWSALAARSPGRKPMLIPAPIQYTEEQMRINNELYKKARRL